MFVLLIEILSKILFTLPGGGDTRNGTSNSVSQSISNSTAGGSRKSLGSANSADRSGYRNNGSVGGPRVLHASGSSTPLAVKRDPGILDDDEDDDDDDEGFDDPGDKWVQSQRKSSTFGFYTPPTSPPPGMQSCCLRRIKRVVCKLTICYITVKLLFD